MSYESRIIFPVPSEAECRSAPSESFKYAHLVAMYCEGCGVDIGSQGATVVPWAVSFDLPQQDFEAYCGKNPPKGPIHLRGYADSLPFETGSLSFVYSSHLIEDYHLQHWPELINAWARCVKPGGYVIIICPEKTRWDAYVAAGGCANINHLHEANLGDFAGVAKQIGLELIEERLTDIYPGDYSVMAILRKP